MNDKTRLLNDALRDAFTPAMRESGFKGSGRSYRRVIGELVQCVYIQSWSGYDRFFVNLGIQPVFLPDAVGEPVNVKTIAESGCRFRGRLHASSGQEWWSYEDLGIPDLAVKSAVEQWRARGESAFAAFGSYPEAFAGIAVEDVLAYRVSFGDFQKGNMEPFLLVMARIRKHEGRIDEARAFLQAGLESGDGSTVLEQHMRECLATLN